MSNNRFQPALGASAALVLAAAVLASCGSNTGSDRDPVVTNSGDIAPSQAVANRVEASGNDQRPRLVAPANGSGGR